MSERAFAAAREFMVERTIVARGVRDERVLAAMRGVPRHRFVPAAQEDEAYADGPLPIGHGATISQPYVVAWMTELAEVAGARVLEVGTGSGYQAAVLALLAREVVSVERVPELAAAARARLADLGVDNVEVVLSDGSVGLPSRAPFDAIVVTAAAPEMPRALLDQLAPGGRLVAPVGPRSEQLLVKVVRTATGLSQENHGSVVFVPLIGEQGYVEVVG